MKVKVARKRSAVCVERDEDGVHGVYPDMDRRRESEQPHRVSKDRVFLETATIDR